MSSVALLLRFLLCTISSISVRGSEHALHGGDVSDVSDTTENAGGGVEFLHESIGKLLPQFTGSLPF
jgi:hypothetical protein